MKLKNIEWFYFQAGWANRFVKISEVSIMLGSFIGYSFIFSAYFWYRETLDISSDVESPEKINWVIGICLVSSWLLVYLAMVKGITESPKVVYVRIYCNFLIEFFIFSYQITAIFPYVVLVIFFFRAVTLKGMGDGVIHLFTPKVKTKSKIQSNNEISNSVFSPA